MIQLAFVYAESEASLARQIADYLERNCPVEVDASFRITSDCDLLDTVGRALGTDAAVLFLSQGAVPKRLNREEWEPLFVAAAAEHRTELGYILVSDCPFPKVLLRSRTFAISDGPVECARKLRRWLIELRPPAQPLFFVPDRRVPALAADKFEELARGMIDQPGVGAVDLIEEAIAFATAARAYFEGVLWIDCRAATVAGVAGEIGAQLGLRLPGDSDSNLAAIGAVLAQHRCLLVTIGQRPDVLAKLAGMGMTSILSVVSPPALEEITLGGARASLQALSNWTGNPNTVPATTVLHRTLVWLLAMAGEWTLACDFARALLAYCRFQERSAEAFEAADLALSAAISRRDAVAASEFGRERAWILEAWGRTPDGMHAFAAPVQSAEQLALF
jgi:hypothetical protein